MAKRAITKWDEICDSVEVDDGLPARESGAWAEEKLWFWNRYIEITATAMIGHPSWSGVVYVDLFAGPGICTLRESGRRIPGSPLIAAHSPKPFTKVLLCEQEEELASACEKRLKRLLPLERFTVFRGDCNLKVDEIVREIPKRALTLAFLDPTGLHLNFTTVQTLSECGRVDLLILFPDAMDVIRNVNAIYFGDEDSRLDRVLGPASDWRNKLSASNQDGATLRKLFVTIYMNQLKKLGYTQFAEETIKGPSGPLYRLVYASKSERGLDFWQKSVSKELGGQRRLF